MAAKKQTNMNVSKDVLCAKLIEIVEHTEQGKVILKCDVCKNNAVVVLCSNCSQCLCKVCHKHHSEENNEHDIVILDKASFCPEHKKSFEYYCEKCDEFVCSSCKVKHSSEDNHNLGVIEEITTKHENFLAKIAAAVAQIDASLSQKETKLIAAQKHLGEQLTEIEQIIDNQYEVQLEKLKKRYDLLKQELLDVVSQKKKVLLAHMEEVKSIQTEVIRVKRLFDDLQTTFDQKVISTKEQIMEFHMQKVEHQFKSLSSNPAGSDFITFDPVTEFAETLGKLVNLSEMHNLPKCATKDETVEFLILTKDRRKQRCTEGGSQVSIELTSFTGEVSAGEVRDNNDGSYTVSIKAEQVGEAKLSAYVDGLKIKGSPFSINVVPSQDVPTKIVNLLDFNVRGNPWGIAVANNDTGMWAVNDNANCRVYIFDSQNQVHCEFGQQGKKDGEFNRPFGMTFDSNGHLYVADGGLHRVQKFDTNGVFILKFGDRGNGDGKLNAPYGVATHTDKVYVTDFYNKRVSVFQTRGRFCFSFGSDHLAGPQDVAINTDQQLLFVTDNCNHKICVFTLDGHYIKKFGQQGHGEGELNLPLGITTWNRKVAISDENHRISIFSEDGQFVRCIGSYGSAEGQLNYPYGIASNLNSVYVTDWINQRVQIFVL